MYWKELIQVKQFNKISEFSKLNFDLNIFGI